MLYEAYSGNKPSLLESCRSNMLVTQYGYGNISSAKYSTSSWNIETLNEYAAPRNEAEQKLAAIWTKVLGVEKVGVNDNFFELGGHSLLMTVMQSKINNEFSI